ncbi:hypothetical protein Tco_1205408, partial [Tanacetum coccineum]
VDGGVDVVEDGASLKMLEDNANKETKEAVVNDGTSDGDDQHTAIAAEAHMEKLCFLKTKLEKLQQVLLLRTPNRKAKTTASSSIDHNDVIFFPVAHLKEKS